MLSSEHTIFRDSCRNFSAGFHNVNALCDDKLRHIAWSIMHHKLDFFHATDCRLDERSMSLAVTLLKSLLGLETLVTYVPVVRTGEVGGYLTIIRGPWSRLIAISIQMPPA